tara:strand:- start:39 stop:1070 length:1032 start_codon:yes stop_codon:yes gene_type:complete
LISVSEIAELVDGKIIGNSDFIIKGACNLKGGKEDFVSFLDNPRYTKYLDRTNASVIIIDKDYDVFEKNKIFIQVKNPKIAFAKVLSKFKKKYPRFSGICKSSKIDKSVLLGNDVYIGENVVIKENVEISNNTIIESGTIILENCKIGSNTYLAPNITIYSDTIIGKNVHIDSGCVIGADGFGWSTLNNRQVKIPQIGNVIIKNNVWVGANCCIDRSTFDSTIIGEGTKLDNLIQIGHNVIIGSDCLISGGSAIGGSTVIGNNVTIAGQVGIIDHLKIGDNSIIAAKSGVFKSFDRGSFISGTPARNHNDRIRQEVLVTKLPELQKKIKKIENILYDKDKNIS